MPTTKMPVWMRSEYVTIEQPPFREIREQEAAPCVGGQPPTEYWQRVQREAARLTGHSFVSRETNFTKWARIWLEAYKKPTVKANTCDGTYRGPVESHLIPYFTYPGTSRWRVLLRSCCSFPGLDCAAGAARFATATCPTPHIPRSTANSY